MRYATRNHAFMPVQTWVLDGPVLRIDEDTGPSRVVPLTGVATVRLAFAPTRPEPGRYRCQLVLRDAQVLEFFNRTYRGVYDFADTSSQYVAFVRAVHAALSQHAPGCRFAAGSTGAAYALNWTVTLLMGLVLGVAALFLLVNGLILLVLLKIALIAVYAPSVFRWLARNRPQAYAPNAIPPTVLPPAGSAQPSLLP